MRTNHRSPDFVDRAIGPPISIDSDAVWVQNGFTWTCRSACCDCFWIRPSLRGWSTPCTLIEVASVVVLADVAC